MMNDSEALARKHPKADKRDLSRLYALDVGHCWRAFKTEHPSVWFLCLYVAFEYIRPQALYPQIDVLPWSQLTLLLAVIAALLDTRTRFAGGTMSTLLMLLVSWVFLSSLFAYRPTDSLDGWVFIANWVIVFYLISNVVNTERRLFVFFSLYLLFNLKMAQHGALTWVERGFSFAGWGLTGSPGWFRNSGEYAIQMLIFGSLIIAYVLGIRAYLARWKLVAMGLVAISGYMAVMGASSRGSQLALALIVGWMLIRTKLGLRALVLAAVVVVSAIYLLPDEQLDRFREVGEDRTSVQRLTYWGIGLDLIRQYPLFGIGYENWMSYVWAQYPTGVGPLQIVELPHNIYIEIAVESGIPAFLIFLAMVFLALYYCQKIRGVARAQGNTLGYFLSLGLEAGLIGYLGAGMFVTVFYYPFFWVQIAMIAALYNVVCGKRHKTTASEGAA